MRSEINLTEHNFRIHNIDTVRVTRDKGYRHSYKNGREKYGFVYVVKGVLRESFENSPESEMVLRASDVFFAPKGSRYVGIYDEDDTEVKIIQFDLSGDELPDYLKKPFRLSLPWAGELIEPFFGAVGQGTQRHPFYYLSCMYNLLWKLDEYYQGIPGKYKRLGNALSEISQNFKDDPPISYYAELCEMSEVSFRRLFREYVGRSPVDYRNDLRLEYARTLLQSREYNVTEVSELSGFSNLSFFIRLFKKKYGHTPKKE